MISTMNKLFFLAGVFVLASLGYALFLNPTSPLPSIDYIGLKRAEVAKKLIVEGLLDEKSGAVLVAAPYGNFIRLKKESDLISNPYVMKQPVWDVNLRYTKNYIKGGYYYYRLTFNKDNIVEKQKLLFASDGFLFL